MRRVTHRGPPWRGVFEGYSRNWVRRHHWKVAKYVGDEEDALQECAIIFYRTREYYRGKIGGSAHLMALYKVTLAREWLALASKSVHMQELEKCQDEISSEMDMPTQYLAVSWHEASKELRHVLVVLSDAPTEVLQFLFQHASINDMNDRIKEFCGIRSRRNVIRELKRLTGS